MKDYNPAQDGTEAMKVENQSRREAFLSKMCDEFKIFILDSAQDHSEDYDDHFEFLKDAMETFIDLKSEE